MREKGHGCLTLHFFHSFNRWSHFEVIINQSIFDQLTTQFKLPFSNCWHIIYLQKFIYKFHIIEVGLFIKFFKEWTAGQSVIEL